MEKLYTCEQIAERYGVKIKTVWTWIREKKLSAIQVGKGYQVTENDLKIFEEQNRTIKDSATKMLPSRMLRIVGL